MLVAIFVVIALLIGTVICAGSFAFWKIFLTVLAVFLLENILYILWAFSTSLLVKDTDKPIEKEIPVCRFAAVSVFSLVISYLGLKVTVHGMEKLPKEGRFLLVCNHRSGFDPVVLMNRLYKYQLSCIAKPSVMDLPCIGKVAYGIGCLSIDRENDRNALKTILTAANYLKQDVCNICIFPEGTRSRSGEMLPFQAGSFKIAQRANAPVAVVSIRGTEQIMKNVPLRRTEVVVDIIELIDAERVKASNTQELAEYSQRLIAESLKGGQA